jgi:hypothetical protein
MMISSNKMPATIIIILCAFVSFEQGSCSFYGTGSSFNSELSSSSSYTVAPPFISSLSSVVATPKLLFGEMVAIVASVKCDILEPDCTERLFFSSFDDSLAF